MILQFDDTRRLLIALLLDEDEDGGELPNIEPLSPEEQRSLIITTAAAMIEIVLCEIAHNAADAREGLTRLVIDMRRNIDARYAARARGRQ